MTNSEDGFTLTELLVVIAITTIVSSAIAAAIFAGLRTTDATANRLVESADAQKTSQYFGPDVQGADQFINSPATPMCSPGPVAADVTRVPLFDLVDVPRNGDDEFVVSYMTDTDANHVELRRTSCTVNKNTRVTAFQNELVLVEDLDTVPEVVCNQLSPCPASPIPLPVNVKLSLSAIGCAAGAPCGPGAERLPYRYEVFATTRRLA